MMYYRRKLLLAILQKGNNILGKINLQKLLFLITKEQKTSFFDFIPYKFGCYSFQANKDLEVLSRYYLLIESQEKNWILKTNTENYFNQLRQEDQKIINEIFENFDINNTSKLTKYVYDKYPYFTINSGLNLSDIQKKKQEKENKKILKSEKRLFSIGYEGISIDTYLNLLIKNNIKLLCDVRKNPLSMKYGFSKNQLKKYCENINIKYFHIADLGIESEKRKNLNTIDDYSKLFKQYEKTLHIKNISLQKLKSLLDKYNRVAITCFEKDYKCCHRSILAKYYNQTIETIEIVNL